MNHSQRQKLQQLELKSENKILTSLNGFKENLKVLSWTQKKETQYVSTK